MTGQANQIFADIAAWLRWAPDWSVALILLAVAAGLGWTVQAVLIAVLRRAVGPGQVFARLLLERARGPLRLALILFALALAVPAAPVSTATAAALQHVLLIAFLTLLGWAAIVAVQLAARVYLRRFQIDVEDNLLARKHTTQIRVLERVVQITIIVFTVAGVLMTFEPVRQYGISILASAGVAGIVAGLAARPVFANLFAGIQIAVSQPIRIDDVVIVEGEWGRIEEITATYVVVRLWDLRRLIVPLSHFIEHPFENWTRETASLLAPVSLFLDYSAPIDAIRAKVDELLHDNKQWDGKVKVVQVVDARETMIEVRVLLSAANSGNAWDLRCRVREALIAFLQSEHPGALPRQRLEVGIVGTDGPDRPEQRPRATTSSD